MEHANIRNMMSQWYSMWGNQLDVKRVVSQTESVETSSPVKERKEEESEKDEDEASQQVLPLHQPRLLRHNAYCRND
jgi:hypothetical protein